MTDARLRVIIDAVDRASSTIKSMSRQNLSEMRRLGTQLTITGAVVSGFGLLAVRSAVNQRVAVGQLDRALSGLNMSYADNRMAIEKAIDSAADISKFSKPELLEGITTMASRFGDLDFALRALPTAVDLAAGAGMPLATAIDMVVGALKGDDGAIKKLEEFGIKITDAHNPLDVLTEINKRFAGSAKEAKTPMDDMKTALSDLMAVIGESILPVLKPMVNTLSDFIKGIGDFLKQHPHLTKMLVDFGIDLALIVAIAGPLLILLSTMGLAMLALGGAVPVLAILGGVAALVLFVRNLKRTKEAAIEIWEWFQENKLLIAAIGLAIIALFAPVIAVILLVTLLLALLVENFETTKTAVIKLWQWMWGGIKDIAEASINFILASTEAFVNSWIEKIDAIVGAINVVIRGFKRLPFMPNINEIDRLKPITFTGVEFGPAPTPAPGIRPAPGGSPWEQWTSGKSAVNVTINGDVYGMEDFKDKVTTAVRDAARLGGFNGVFAQGPP